MTSEVEAQRITPRIVFFYLGIRFQNLGSLRWKRIKPRVRKLNWNQFGLLDSDFDTLDMKMKRIRRHDILFIFLGRSKTDSHASHFLIPNSISKFLGFVGFHVWKIVCLQLSALKLLRNVHGQQVAFPCLVLLGSVAWSGCSCRHAALKLCKWHCWTAARSHAANTWPFCCWIEGHAAGQFFAKGKLRLENDFFKIHSNHAWNCEKHFLRKLLGKKLRFQKLHFSRDLCEKSVFYHVKETEKTLETHELQHELNDVDNWLHVKEEEHEALLAMKIHSGIDNSDELQGFTAPRLVATPQQKAAPLPPPAACARALPSELFPVPSPAIIPRRRKLQKNTVSFKKGGHFQWTHLWYFLHPQC